MSRWLKLILLCAFVTISVAPAQAAQAAESVSVREGKQCVSPAKVKLKEDLRKLWTDHVLWTRSYIVSALAGLEDKDKTLERLLKNQQDIGDAIKPFYGEAAGNKLTKLLKEHILLAGKVLEAAKAGNGADLEKYNREWHRNADDIAKFLSSLNPNWSEKALKEMLYTHLQYVTEEVVARLGKKWDTDIAVFDKNLNHMLMLADILTEGIVKQFPERFK
ncbi:glycosyltransferase [Bacillus sp. FJAT-27264]|uniref:glycosyltransferase n=1 Tax=Paenibacillus sp. (strain DSM 101736 / FJAT-27264) TaxID=1850362 RepID=UPI000807E955|nr:glycosyltransferase [Bacillus sp. FJAT-27264]OBZ08407.1 glycosyltransferase [Bacillus sp. FJAT-27264]